MIDHITHFEDLILEQGALGGMKINNHLWSLQKGDALVSTKWDGAPSIFAGWLNGEFFVSTKSYLNNNPVTYNLNNIENADIATGLKIKLRHCLAFLPDVIPKGLVLQGDLLFTPGEVFATPGHPGYWMTHPNTLVYAFPDKWWEDWKVGVAWHSWIDERGNVSHPHFGKLLNNDDVLSIDPIIDSYTIDEDITSGPAEAFKRLDSDFLGLLTDKNVSTLIKQAYNANIRAGIDTLNAQEVYTFAYDKLVAHLETLKSERGQENHKRKMRHILFVLAHVNQMAEVLEFQNEVRVSKSKVINRLETQSKVKTFVSTDDGLLPAAHEGYVVFGQSESMKFVERSQFSHYNFSPIIHKGWDAPTRT